jgi:tetratricopeptide (TPR) repeat protein
MRIVALLLLVALPVLADAPPGRLLSGLGDHHHAIATRSPEAQAFFDQGLRLCFAFNHEEAVHAFEHAAALDPKSPMPHWGIALALGPNINMDVDPDRERAAYAEIQKARGLMRHGSEADRAYVEALTVRYSDAPHPDLKALAVAYEEAMGRLSARFPDDLDAATLYAESTMDLRPWHYWNADGTPAEGTTELLAVLESVLRRDPSHPGANHYYIHAVEASPHPERALASAGRLGALMPGAGHLVHMPSHIYLRTGDYGAAARANEQAVAADQTYAALGGEHPVYDLMYMNHNVHFLAASLALAGRSTEALRAAGELGQRADGVLANVPELDPMMLPPLEAFVAAPTFTALRFHRWDAVLAMPEPDPRLPMARALRPFARAVALAATGKRRDAAAARDAFTAARNALPPGTGFGFNPGARVLDVAAAVLDARLATAAGDRKGALSAWQRAVDAQDLLAYDEPADWYYPVRESLGGALLAAGKPAEAEAVFRADLEHNPRNGRSLFGLAESLRAQKRDADAAWVRAQFEAAWREADGPLVREDL